MFGFTTPVTFSISRITEVWSKVSWQTKPPTVHGETMMHGTRKPRPIGSLAPSTVMNSPAVPAGRWAAVTWSN